MQVIDRRLLHGQNACCCDASVATAIVTMANYSDVASKVELELVVRNSIHGCNGSGD